MFKPYLLLCKYKKYVIMFIDCDCCVFKITHNKKDVNVKAKMLILSFRQQLAFIFDFSIVKIQKKYILKLYISIMVCFSK